MNTLRNRLRFLWLLAGAVRHGALSPAAAYRIYRGSEYAPPADDGTYFKHGTYRTPGAPGEPA
jgi:hypothetical protein